MTVQNWVTTTIDGKDYLVIDVAKLRIPLEWDPSSTVFLAVAAPDGALLNYPALVAGDAGVTPDIDGTIVLTALEPDDPTPDFASFSEISPNVYQLHLGLHKGLQGADGVMILDPLDYGTPVAGRTLVLNDTLDAFVYQAIKCGDRYRPASFAAAPTGNSAYTLAAIPIGAQPWDWRPSAEGQCIITGTGADFQGDYLVRLSTAGVVNGETAGPIIARGFGPIGANASALSTVLSSAMAAGSSGTADKVLQGNAATLYVRVERQSGAQTFSTLAATTLCEARVNPIP